MALLRKLFYRKPPDGLLEISDRIYVFDCCFTTESWEEKNYKEYLSGIVSQLLKQYVDAALLVSNFRKGQAETPISMIMSEYGMTIMDYPMHYEGCPILSMELIHHYLRSTESWLTLGPNNILLLHCERGAWPVLAFMLAALLIYRKQYTGEQRTLDMVYKQAPRELLPMLSLLNPIPSQIRYLQYVSRRNVASQWPPLDRTLNLDCIIFRLIPAFNEEGGCRPLFRIYGQDPLIDNDRNPKLLFTSQKKSKAIRSYKQVDSELVKIDINCCIQGDVVLECTSLHKDMENEDMMFRIMFNTAFIRSNIIILNRDDIDTLWDTKDYFPKDFRAEVLFSDMDAAASVVAANSSCFEEEGLPMEAFAKVQEFFSHVDWLDSRADVAQRVSAILKEEDSSVLIRCEPAFSSSPGTPSRKGPSSEIATSSPPRLKSTLGYPGRPAPSPTPAAAVAAAVAAASVALHPPTPSLDEESATGADVHLPSLSNVPSQTTENKLAEAGPLQSKQVYASTPKDSAAKSGSPPLPPPLPPTPFSKESYGKAGPPGPMPPHKLGSSGSSPEPPPPPPPPPPTGCGIQAQKLQVFPSIPCAPPPPYIDKGAPKMGTSSGSVPPPPSAPDIRSQNQQVPQCVPCAPPTPSNIDKTAQKIAPPPPPPPPLPGLGSQSQKQQVSQSIPCVPPPLSNIDKGTSKMGTIPAPAPAPPPPPPPGPRSQSQKQQVSPSVPSAPPPPSNIGKGATKLGTVPAPAPPSSSLNTKGSKNSQTKKLKPLHWLKLTRAVSGSLWAETQKSGESSIAPEIDMSELENLFSASAPISDQKTTGGKSRCGLGAPKSDKVQLIDNRRASNCEIMLSKVKVPIKELMGSVLSLEDSSLEIDQLENLIKFCPTKEEMELLKGYKGEVDKLGRCEQFFLELMRVPRVEAKLRVFSFKMQFSTQVSDLRKSLSIVNSAADQIRSSVKLKRIMQTVLSLGNALNQGTARGSAVGFRLDSLLKLTETRARNNKMTLMHYLCKVVAEKLPELLDFSKDLGSTEPATKVQLKYLAEEMQAINKGLEKVMQELSMSENDGPVSDEFRKKLKEFLCFAEAEVRSLALLYSGVGRNVDALIMYFGEDPSRCPFEQVVITLLNFMRMFNQSHEDNCKQLELEKKKSENDLGSPVISNSKGIGNMISSPSKGGKIK